MRGWRQAPPLGREFQIVVANEVIIISVLFGEEEELRLEKQHGLGHIHRPASTQLSPLLQNVQIEVQLVQQVLALVLALALSPLRITILGNYLEIKSVVVVVEIFDLNDGVPRAFGIKAQEHVPPDLLYHQLI